MLSCDPVANGAEWVPVRETTSDLSPAEEVLAQQLCNITIPDPQEDMQRLDHFRERQEGHDAEALAEAFHAGGALCKEEEEAMEQALPDREEVGSKSLEESEESEAKSESSEGGLKGPIEGPAKEAAKEPVINHPALRQESPPECSQEGEEEVVIHMPKDEIDCLC